MRTKQEPVVLCRAANEVKVPFNFAVFHRKQTRAATMYQHIKISQILTVYPNAVFAIYQLF